MIQNKRVFYILFSSAASMNPTAGGIDQLSRPQPSKYTLH